MLVLLGLMMCTLYTLYISFSADFVHKEINKCQNPVSAPSISPRTLCTECAPSAAAMRLWYSISGFRSPPELRQRVTELRETRGWVIDVVLFYKFLWSQRWSDGFLAWPGLFPWHRDAKRSLVCRECCDPAMKIELWCGTGGFLLSFWQRFVHLGRSRVNRRLYIKMRWVSWKYYLLYPCMKPYIIK